MTDAFAEQHPPHLLVLNAAEGVIQCVLAAYATTPQHANAELQTTVRAVQEWHTPSQGVEVLVPGIRSMLERLHLPVQTISRIACVRGPGSFTGIRLVLTTAAALARCTNARCAGIDYLPVLASGAADALQVFSPTQLESPCFWVLTHARRNLVHAQAFSEKNGALSATTDILVLSCETFVAQLAHGTGTPLLLGSGVTKNRAILTSLLALHAPHALLLPDSFSLPSPMHLLQAAQHASYSQDDIEPLYVRGCDAEENLDSIAKKLHIDPDKARKALHTLLQKKPDV